MHLILIKQAGPSFSSSFLVKTDKKENKNYLKMKRSTLKVFDNVKETWNSCFMKVKTLVFVF